MRHFTSYGPVNPRQDFCVERRALVEDCVGQLVGDLEDPAAGGHYFTIWGARQTGKTWLMRRAIQEIRARYPQFYVATLSMQDLSMKDSDPDEVLWQQFPNLFRIWTGLAIPTPTRWMDVGDLFRKGSAPFDRPVILLIDEFDSLPAPMIDSLVSQFRGLYLNREGSILHGLALVGVRSVLGVDSQRGSPFNVQRSLHVPNLTRDEVIEMFRQFQNESGQPVDPQIPETLHELTRGQPGLVGWFGDLLTDKYNLRPQPIGMHTWHRVYAAACQLEPNNTMLNLLKKAKGPHLPHVLEIFSRTDVPFSFGQDWCNYLYLSGIIDGQETMAQNGLPQHVCRFSSPFVQQRLFNDLSGDVHAGMEDLPLDPMDALADVFTAAGIDVPALLSRYVAYLARLHDKGADPWKDQPRRKDLHHTEAVGHFHLYRWLCTAVGDQCVVSPEFPTGNGTVDLVLRWRERPAPGQQPESDKWHVGVIEVKSFVSRSLLMRGQEQAAEYAVKLGLSRATLAVFVPVTDEKVLRSLSGDRNIGTITVTTVAISWHG